MKANKIVICYYIAALCFYISALIYFIIDKDTSMAVMFFGLGSLWACLAANKNNNQVHEKDRHETENVVEHNDINEEK